MVRGNPTEPKGNTWPPAGSWLIIPRQTLNQAVFYGISLQVYSLYLLYISLAALEAWMSLELPCNRLQSRNLKVCQNKANMYEIYTMAHLAHR